MGVVPYSTHICSSGVPTDLLNVSVVPQQSVYTTSKRQPICGVIVGDPCNITGTSDEHMLSKLSAGTSAC